MRFEVGAFVIFDKQKSGLIYPLLEVLRITRFFK